MPTNKELEVRIKEIEKRLDTPPETPPIKHALSDEDAALIATLRRQVGRLEGVVQMLSKLVVVMCAERGEFIDEPQVLRFNLGKRMKECLIHLPSLNESMTDD